MSSGERGQRKGELTKGHEVRGGGKGEEREGKWEKGGNVGGEGSRGVGRSSER